MLEKVSSKLVLEWMAFYKIEPFGSEADFMGHAIVASTVANASRGKNTKAYKPEAFMPKFDKKKQSVAEMIQIAQMYTVGLGGKDKRKPEAP